MGSILIFMAGIVAGGAGVTWLKQRRTVSEEVVTITAVPDALETIKGIGAVYAARLKAAGINTFHQLAQTPPERLKEIVGADRSNLQIDTTAWIVQAEALAKADVMHAS